MHTHTHTHTHSTDGDFSESRFRVVVNAALANNLGNMLNRSLALVAKNCGSQVGCSSARTHMCVCVCSRSHRGFALCTHHNVRVHVFVCVGGGGLWVP